jgi:ribosomal protein S18 acetylase RimI-like enzyme
MVDVQVRRATPEDAERIGEIKVKGWRAAYAGLLPDAALNALSAPDQSKLFRARIADSATAGSLVVRVAQSKGEVVGYVNSGPYRGDELPGFGEIYALYVDPAHWGAGAGRRLMAAAERDLARQGFVDAALWVLEANSAGRRFYEHVGWVSDGERGERCELENASEVRYRKRLPGN